MDHLAHVDLAGLKGVLAGFEFGEVEDAADGFEQVFRAGMNALGGVLLVGVEFGLEEHVGQAENPVQGRAARLRSVMSRSAETLTVLP